MAEQSHLQKQLIGRQHTANLIEQESWMGNDVKVIDHAGFLVRIRQYVGHDVTPSDAEKKNVAISLFTIQQKKAIPSFSIFLKYEMNFSNVRFQCVKYKKTP
jgi:hypothetical protein